MIIEELIKYVYGQQHFSQTEADLIRRAFSFAKKHYMAVTHPTGRPYIEYSLGVVNLLVDIGSDAAAISATLIYPPFISPGKILDDLKRDFKGEGNLLNLIEEVLYLNHLEGGIWSIVFDRNASDELVKRQYDILRKMFFLTIDDEKSKDHKQTDLTPAHFKKKERQTENLIRMFLAAIIDPRALIIKLVDHLYSIKLYRTLSIIQQEELNHRFLAELILTVYAPLADRLGIWSLKSELEDMSFRLLEPDKYKAIAAQLALKKQERKIQIDEIIFIIYTKLEAFGIRAEITGRVKHLYGIYQKMVAKKLTFEQINDLLGIRIIVDTVEDCYNAQAIIHAHWPPATDVYDGAAGKDWIIKPKENHYQSLHTTVAIENRMVEVQIRTHEMHKIAEYGIAAQHWRYKEWKTYVDGRTPQVTRVKDQVWGIQLAELRKSLVDKNESTLIKNHFNDRVYVITPESYIADLPAGATPLDFAYHLHTNIGHSYMGAKVNGRFARMDYELKNGDIVEILISRVPDGPKPEWLSANKDMNGKNRYVYARTLQTRNKIRRWYKKREE